MSYRFHAAAPPGEWINDPNALDHADGRYRLHVQHAADAPAFRRIGWGRLTSPDLLHWRWEGVAVPADAGGSAYSGSLADGRAFFTRHSEGAEPRQHQVARILDAPGGDSPPFGPAGRNVRDPFVWRERASGDWRMLVAHPCDWNDWRDEPPSRLSLWRSPDLCTWRRTAWIGPWQPPGVLWEVPTAIDWGDRQVLIVSEVDRRDGAAACRVRYWPGRFGEGFVRDAGAPQEGWPMDLGPDFYAAISNVVEGWPTDERVAVGWASSWQTARLMRWPDRRGGGPVSLPRVVTLNGHRLRQRPIAAATVHRAWHEELTAGPHDLLIAGEQAQLAVRLRPAGIAVTRTGEPAWCWQAAHDLGWDGGSVEIYLDGPLVEIFHRDFTVTAVLPDGSPPRITCLPATG